MTDGMGLFVRIEGPTRGPGYEFWEADVAETKRFESKDFDWFGIGSDRLTALALAYQAMVGGGKG